MKKYITIPKPIEQQLIRAQQIQESDFTGEHPNADHVAGVTYDAKKQMASLGHSKDKQTGAIGDYIVQDLEGVLSISKREEFEATYQPT